MPSPSTPPSSTLTPSLPGTAAPYSENNPYVLSYLALRKAVGYIALLLPWTLFFAANIHHAWRWRFSISGYYYTDTRNILVGSLCAIAMFQMACRGYKNTYGHLDEIGSWLSSLFALGVAFFPTLPVQGDWAWPATPARMLMHKVHVTSAILLFFTLAFFCLYLFRLSTSAVPTPMKLVRNRLFIVCGCGILASMLFVLLASSHIDHASFIGETSALTFFGIAWLIKGGAAFTDKSPAAAQPAATPTVKPRIPRSS
jgi:hypothetical protein